MRPKMRKKAVFPETKATTAPPTLSRTMMTQLTPAPTRRASMAPRGGLRTPGGGRE